MAKGSRYLLGAHVVVGTPALLAAAMQVKAGQPGQWLGAGAWPRHVGFLEPRRWRRAPWHMLGGSRDSATDQGGPRCAVL